MHIFFFTFNCNSPYKCVHKNISVFAHKRMHIQKHHYLTKKLVQTQKQAYMYFRVFIRKILKWKSLHAYNVVAIENF